MAEKTYTVTVASGTLYISGGTGNVFYLDGVRDMALEWVKGGTLRFDQSDNSNDGHPLLFTTSTSDPGGNIISSGVTYYLDGSSNQAAYSNTTSFNAASTRYIEIAPTSESDFHYYCYVHGIGMGGAIDVTQNTWGALTWSQGDYGQQNIFTVAVSGSSATSSLGSAAAFPSQGWGRDTWGLENWGQNAATVFLTGQSITASVGDGTNIGVPRTGWGGNVWNKNEWGELTDNTAVLTGFGLTASVGSVSGFALQGWGRAEWGEEPWGESDSPVVNVTGVEFTGSVGELTAFPEQGWGGDTWNFESWGESSFTVELDGQSITSNLSHAGWNGSAWGEDQGWGMVVLSPADVVGLSGQQITSAVPSQFDIPEQIQGVAITSSVGAITPDQMLVGLSGQEITSSVGTALNLVLVSVIELTGVQTTSGIGSVESGIVEFVPVTGVSSTTSVGSISLDQMTVGLGSQSSTFSVGSITPADVMGLTGQQITSSLAGFGVSTGFGIQAYQDVDTGVNITYSDVA